MPFVDDDFSGPQQTPPFAGADHPRFNWTLDSPSNSALFVAGDPDIEDSLELTQPGGTDFVAFYASPDGVHQAVEVLIRKGNSGSASVVKAGVFLRYDDVNNHIKAYFNRATQRLEIVQVVAGTPTTLANPATTAEPGSDGVSVRIEAMGWRLRWWFNPRYAPCADQPPDGAVNLLTAPSDPDDVGEWGIYLETNGTNDLAVTHFQARELPSIALPPPDVTLTNASGFNFAPLSITIATTPTNALELEWEIAPADIDDFAEAYVDRTPASTISRVVWARKGYTYDVRVRALDSLGGIGPWTDAVQIVASGTKVDPAAAIYPDDDYPDVVPDYVLEHEQTADATGLVASTNRERLLSNQKRPRRRWTLQYTNRDKSEMKQLRDTFNFCQGRVKPLKFLLPSGEQVAIRFDQDELEMDVADEGQDSPLVNVSVQLIEVVLGVVGTFDLTLTLDDSL